MQYINCFDVIIGCEQTVMLISNFLSLVVSETDNKYWMQGSQYIINFQKTKALGWMNQLQETKSFSSDYASFVQYLYKFCLLFS